MLLKVKKCDCKISFQILGLKKYTPFSFIFKCKAKSLLISLAELKWTRRQSTWSKNPASIIPLNHCFVAEQKEAFQHMKILLYSLALWFWVVDQRRMFNLLRKINLFLFCIPQVFKSIFSCVINIRSRHLSDCSQCLHWVQSKTSQLSYFAFYTKYLDKAKARGLYISSALRQNSSLKSCTGPEKSHWQNTALDDITKVFLINSLYVRSSMWQCHAGSDPHPPFENDHLKILVILGEITPI